MSEERVEVLRYSPVRRRRRRAALAIGLLLAVAASYLYGLRTAVEGVDRMRSRGENLQTELDHQTLRADSLEQQVANLRRGAEVDRQVIEDVRREMHASRERIDQLEEEIAFYKGLMDPGSGASGLDIRSFELQAAEDGSGYDFKLVLQQVAKQHNVIKGYATVTVLGQDTERERQFSLHELSEDLEDERITLRFRYFQTVEGRLRLPPDFRPQKVKLQASSTGRKAQQVEKLLDWTDSLRG